MEEHSEQEIIIKPHAIMVCYPLQGHINPFVEVAIKLASKGFTITFVHTQHVHHQISQAHIGEGEEKEEDIFAGLRKSGLDIRYATISDGLPLEFDRTNNLLEFLGSVFYDFPSHVDEFVGKIVGGSDEPSSSSSSSPSSSSSSSSADAFFLVADTFQSWPAAIASKYKLVNVSFWTQPALIFSMNHHLHLLREHGHVPFTGEEEDINYLPGAKSMSTRHFTSYLRSPDLSTFIHKLIFKAFEDVKEADFILHTTVQELEHETLSVLNQHKPSFAIGPVSFINSPNNNVARSLWSESDCTHWLDTKPRGSVLYISFGSLAKVDKSDFMEIARGVLLSGVSFLWVIRPGGVGVTDDNDPLLAKISDIAKDRGLIVPWCKQKVVLSSGVIGGFLSHGGWNSVLESLYYGVPLICNPFIADQTTNRTLLVDDWKVGINLCDEVPVSREEVAEKIKRLMTGETSHGTRREAERIAGVLKDALSPHGSSEQNLDRFVKELTDKIKKRHCVSST